MEAPVAALHPSAAAGELPADYRNRLCLLTMLSHPTFEAMTTVSTANGRAVDEVNRQVFRFKRPILATLFVAKCRCPIRVRTVFRLNYVAVTQHTLQAPSEGGSI